MQIVSPLNLNTNELQNAIIQNLGSDPTSIEGRFYYNSTAKALKYYNGTAWQTLGVSGSIDVGSATGVLLPSHGGTGIANNDAYTITLNGAVSFANSFTTVGAYPLTLTLTAATGVTLPTTGTLATLTGVEAFTNKTYNGLTVTSTTGTLTLVNGSSLITAGAFSTTLTSTGITNVTLPTSGTLMSNQMTTLGDMIYGGASGANTRLAGSTTNGTNWLSQITTGGVAAAPSWRTSTQALSDLGAMPLSGGNFTGNVSFSSASFTLTLTKDPTSPMEAATKQYVDNVAVGLTDWKESVRVATTANITLAGGAPNIVDGVTLAANDRILVKNQSTASQNGIYYVSTLGTGANGTWTRATDADTSAEVTSGMYMYVSEGSATNKGQYVLNTPNPITLNTTALTFVRFNGGSTAVAGNGIDITGDTFSVRVSGSTTYTANSLLFASSTSAIGQITEVANANRPLISVAAGAPVFSNLTLTNNAATLTLAASSSFITTGAFNTTLAASASASHTLPGEASKLTFLASATTPAANQIAYFDGTTAKLANLAVNATASSMYLRQVSSGAPTWTAISASDVTTGLGYTPVKKFVQSMTGAGPSYGPYTHGLGSGDISVTVLDQSGNVVYPDILVTSTQITVTYGVGAPTAVTHKLVAV